LIASRANYRFVAQQMANAACLQIFAARTVVPASHLDCLPLRNGLQQVAHESRLAYFRGETTDCYYCWKLHSLVSENLTIVKCNFLPFLAPLPSVRSAAKRHGAHLLLHASPDSIALATAAANRLTLFSEAPQNIRSTATVITRMTFSDSSFFLCRQY
jgi:hypothetical protein